MTHVIDLKQECRRLFPYMLGFHSEGYLRVILQTSEMKTARTKNILCDGMESTKSMEAETTATIVVRCFQRLPKAVSISFHSAVSKEWIVWRYDWTTTPWRRFEKVNPALESISWSGHLNARQSHMHTSIDPTSTDSIWASLVETFLQCATIWLTRKVLVPQLSGDSSTGGPGPQFREDERMPSLWIRLGDTILCCCM